ncbi:sensor histidine kinase [Saccharothrix australiensis]|uniref:histidine kinase n=1 Tax=Saccharothrix australiensis TaxID=2072 RepID=A0A495W1G8_9PSEU|nr:histidine kinase [Saccharothrix australiensis]RKT54555.1 signal transduction histidine kinase [Saccharothrix australiensis]
MADARDSRPSTRLRGAALGFLRALVFVVARGARPETPAGFTGSRRTRSAIVLVAALAAFLAIAPIQQSVAPKGDAAVLLLGALTALPVLAVLRHPLVAWRLTAVMVLVTPFAYAPHVDLVRVWGWPWTMGFALAAGFVLYAVAESYAQPVPAQVWVLTAAAAWPHLPDRRNLFLVAALAAGVALLGNAVRLRRQADRQRLTEQARTAALEERSRIARELHDVVSHHMSALVLRADAVPYRLPGLAPEVRAEFDVLQRIARDGLTEMRRMLGVLRSTDDEADTAPQPGLADVAEMVARFRATGAEITLGTDYDGRSIPAGVGLSAYQIVQEALSNAARHAPGGAVSIRLGADDGRLRVVVANAAGVRPALDADPRRPRHGLVGMGERVRVLGGRFSAGRTPDGGFAVVAELPLDEGCEG